MISSYHCDKLTQIVISVPQKPLVGRSHERVEQQERRTAVIFDVKHVDLVTIFGLHGMLAIRRMTVVFDQLTLEIKHTRQ